jgi:hypothetical protein
MCPKARTTGNRVCCRKDGRWTLLLAANSSLRHHTLPGSMFRPKQQSGLFLGALNELCAKMTLLSSSFHIHDNITVIFVPYSWHYCHLRSIFMTTLLSSSFHIHDNITVIFVPYSWQHYCHLRSMFMTTLLSSSFHIHDNITTIFVPYSWQHYYHLRSIFTFAAWCFDEKRLSYLTSVIATDTISATEG